MFRHVVMFRWKSEATEAQKRAIERGLSRLPEVIDEVVSYGIGPDHGLADDNWDCVVVADFDDRAAYERYRDHAEHQDLIATTIRPVLAERAAVQYEIT